MLSSRLNSFAMLVAFLFIQCGDVQPVEYIVYVQSIEAPESVQADDRLDFTLHGTVGPNGCFRVSHLEIARSAGKLDVTVFGAQDIGHSVVCTDEIAVLDETLTVNPPFAGDAFVISVHQPDGTTLRERVTILE